MKKLLLSILISGLISVSCSKENTSDTSNNSETSDKRSYGYFNAKLKAAMVLSDIKSTFGEPDSDIGSAGTHIYVYKLKDATEVRIGYTDRILYAHHVDKNGRLLHTLI